MDIKQEHFEDTGEPFVLLEMKGEPIEFFVKTEVKEEMDDPKLVEYIPMEEGIDKVDEVDLGELCVHADMLVDVKHEPLEINVSEVKTEVLLEKPESCIMKTELYSGYSYEGHSIFKFEDCPDKIARTKIKKEKKVYSQEPKRGQTIRKIFKCPVCLKGHSSQKPRNRHFNRHFGKFCNACSKCGKFFIKRNQYLSHYSFHLVTRKWSNKLTRDLKSHPLHRNLAADLYQDYIKKLKPTRTYNCVLCNKAFNCDSNLYRHLRSHIHQNLTCEICLRSFSQKRYLDNHMVIHAVDKPFKCEYCFKDFSRKRDLVIHTRGHTGEKPYQCQICLKSFADKSYFSTHTKIHSGDKKHKCPICSKAFVRKGDLSAHQATHEGRRDYQCPICDKQFSKKGGLDVHARIHSGEKPFKCDHCSKEFKQKAQCDEHVRCHTGEKPFQCALCEKKFSKKGTLNTHMLSHQGIKRFKCTMCTDKYFSRNDALTRHMQKVHGQGEKVLKRTVYKCTFCPRQFTRKDGLQKHLANFHTEEDKVEIKVEKDLD